MKDSPNKAHGEKGFAAAKDIKDVDMQEKGPTEDNKPMAHNPDSLKETMEEPPTYDNSQEILLDPTFVFNAEAFRPTRPQKDRDLAFAGATVKFIASQMEREISISERELGSDVETWDGWIGYRAVEAFQKNRIHSIIEAVKLDLRRRGFVVEKLDLFLRPIDNTVCWKDAWRCGCPMHAIYVRWKLVIPE